MTLHQAAIPLYHGTMATNLGSGRFGPVNVAGYDNLLASLIGDGATNVSVTFSWGTLAALSAVGTGAEELITSTSINTFANSQPLVARIRNQGPYLRVNWSTLAPTRALELWATNRPMNGDGPFTPARTGYALLNATSGSLGVFATQTFILPPYCGPAKLYVRGGGGGGAQAFVQASGFEIGGTSCGTNTNGEAEVIIPPDNTSVTVQNVGGAAQTVAVAVVCA